jgi:putative PEP-CTERM system TPR-repeat lipoprotein
MHYQNRRGLMLLLASTALGLACGGDPNLAKHAHFERGNAYVEGQRYEEAILEFRNAIQQDPLFGEARHRLARAYAAVNDSRNALEQFVRAADLLPHDRTAQLDAVKALLLARQATEARVRIEGVLQRDPTNVDAHILHASAIAALGDLDGAVETVQAAISLQPERASSYIELATLEMARGRKEAAHAAIEKALAANPRSPEALVALANLYQAAGQAADGERTLRRAEQIAPQSPLVNRTLADWALASGRPQDAEAPLRRLADGGDSTARLRLADYYVVNQRASEAEPVLRDLAKRPESYAAATVRLAGIQYDTGRVDQAHALVDQVLASDPRNAQLLIVKGGWQLRERKIDQALATAQAAVAADPRLSDAHFLEGSAQAALGRRGEAIKAYSEVLSLMPGSVEAQKALSTLHLASGRRRDALAFAQEAVHGAPRDGAARLLLVRALLENREASRALHEIQQVMPQLADVAETHLLMGLTRRALRDTAGARLAFERALARDPSATEALAGLVRLDVGAKRLDDARRRVDDALRAAPEDPALLVLAARTYATAGDAGRAETLLKTAIAVTPTSIEAYNMLAQLYVSQNRLDAALAEYERIVERDPTNVAFRTLVGMILQVQGRMDAAMRVFEDVVARDRRAALAANNLAYMYAEAGTNLDRALALAQAAKEELPDDADVSDTLGWVYYKKGHATLAVEPLEHAVWKEASNATFHYHLGLAYLKAGHGSARATLARALELDPGSPLAIDARRALQEGGA